MGKIRVALLAGGWSGERDVSLRSGQAVRDALDGRRYHVSVYDPREDLERLLREREGVDIAFILLHGRLGEDGCLQGFLEVLGIPYVGSGVLSSAMALNKPVAKEQYQRVGLPVAEHVLIRKGEVIDLQKIRERLGPRTVVKPACEGSSLGISVCASHETLLAGIERAFQCDEEAMVEAYVEGREITCCVLGNRELESLPLIEIVPGASYRFFDYEAKYTPGATREICPAPLSESIALRAAEYAKSAHRALKCSVWSRTDMMVRDQEIYLLETNTIPGMTENSLFPLAARTAGLSLGALVDRLITLSLEAG
jgi:D-alanine-D-alanine ligase